MFLHRDLLSYFKKWKETSDKKPILLRGARQVGKSRLVKKLGEEFEHFIELNFEENPEITAFFDGSLDPAALITHLSNFLGIKIIPGKSLLFLDEIQNCPRAIMSLRYFFEKLPQLHVIGAGSLIEFELQNIATPVGRIQFIYMYPLSFGEYLTVCGKDELRKYLLESKELTIPEPIHRQLLSYIRDYTLIGGMPEVVQKYIQSSDYNACQNILRTLLETYRSDFGKYAKKSQIKYLRQLFDSLPLQTGKKIKYSNISQNIKSRDLAAALDLLEQAGIVYKVYHSNANGIPLGAEKNLKKFKLLFFDIGLMQQLSGLNLTHLFLDPDITEINQGNLAELLVGLELITYQNPCSRPLVYYWHREAKSSNAEVDYLIEKKGAIVPIEVKSGSEGRMLSMHLFLKEKNVINGVRISKYQNTFHQNIQTIPFYGIEAFIKN
ncbi:ATP-binding protein [bacterium]|nr:ATP-binding protein [bacterium]